MCVASVLSPRVCARCRCCCQIRRSWQSEPGPPRARCSSLHRRMRAAGKYYQRSTFQRPRRVRGARASLEPGRGSDSRPGRSVANPAQGRPCASFSGKKFLNGAVFTDVKAPLNFAGREQALVSPRICKVGKGCSGASLEAVCLKVLCKFAGWGYVQRRSFRGQGVF